MTAQITKGSASVVINGLPAARVGDLTNGETEASVAAAVASGVAGALSNITAPLQFAAGAAMSAANGVMQIAAGGANVVSFGNTAAAFQLPVVLPGGNSSTNNEAASVQYVLDHAAPSTGNLPFYLQNGLPSDIAIDYSTKVGELPFYIQDGTRSDVAIMS